MGGDHRVVVASAVGPVAVAPPWHGGHQALTGDVWSLAGTGSQSSRVD